jgi:DHA1 family arabinose polymer transporter-like MFS transporter
MGTFGLGITEFVMMAILPNVASDFSVSIPVAGHLISAYALGVCVGAPMLLMLGRTWPLKRIILMLCCIFVSASALMAVSPSYGVFLLARFCAGLPHGAYFGVTSIVADRISPDGKSAFAVAVVSVGMAIANLIGIPLGTWLTGILSWRLVFIFACPWGIATLLAIWRFVPSIPPLPNIGFKGTFRFLKHLAPWIVILGTLLGNCGVFCYYSYIAPLLINMSGIPTEMMTFMMVLAGAGMVVGNLSGGKISDKAGPGHMGRYGVMTMCLMLALIFFFSQNTIVSVVCMVITTAALFSVSAPQQLLLLRYSDGGELLGGAMVQIAFNLGNAIGAFSGGVPISLGMPYNYCALVGLCFTIMAFVAYTLFIRKYESKRAS